MVVVRQEEKIINRKPEIAVVTTHLLFVSDDGPVHLHCAKRWFKVTEEGPEDLFFGDEPVEEQEIGVGQQEEVPDLVSQFQNLGCVNPNNIMELEGLIMVDDDNEPAPENIPTPDDANASDVFTEWGDTGVC